MDVEKVRARLEVLEPEKIHCEILEAEIKAIKKELKFIRSNRIGTPEERQRLDRRLQNMVRKHSRKIAKNERHRERMLAYMMQLEEPACRLLVARYYNGCTWEQIADAQGYCLRTIYRLHDKALASLAEIIP